MTFDPADLPLLPAVVTSPGSPLSAESFVTEVARACREERLFDTTRGTLVMVSGGQDSLALLHVLSKGRLGYGGPGGVRVLHVNHHLRGPESEADETLVREQCAALGVEVTVVDAKLDKGAGNLQARAREARRAAALTVAGAWELPRIAVAHTLDDQVETMLYRLGRYGGVAALRGMRPAVLPWVRPLLGVRRVDTEAYCRAAGLIWAVDRGNDDPGYARTGLRSTVLPAWEASLPGAVRAAGRAAEVAAEILALVDEWVAAAGRWAAPAAIGGQSSGGGRDPGPALATEQWSAAHLAALPPALRRAFVHGRLAALGDVEVSRTLVRAVEKLLEGGGTAAVDLGAGWSAVRTYDRVRFEKRSPDVTEQPTLSVRLPVPGMARWGTVTVAAAYAERFRAPDPTSEAYLDADAVETACRGGTLVVRAAVPGDRFHALGAPGERKLQDVLVDLRVPARHRARVPLVVAGDRVIWAVGFAVAEGGRISATTRRLLHLRLQ